MFARTINEKLLIRLSIPQFADQIFAVTDRNRDFLRRWLPWLDRTTAAANTRDFLKQQLERFAKGDALNVTVFYEGRVAGIAGFHTVDLANSIGHIGYWLGEEFNGKGIMTAVVRDLIHIGKDYYSLQKIEIRCATNNSRSRAIPERLGFTHEGTLRRAEKVGDAWLDLEVYGLLIDTNTGQNSGPRG